MGGPIDGKMLALGGHRTFTIEFRNFIVAHSNDQLMPLDGAAAKPFEMHN